MSTFKKIFVPTYMKEDKKDIALLLYTHNLSPVFYEDEHPYSDEIDGMELDIHTAGIFNAAAESAKKYNAIAVPSAYLGNDNVEELINYCILKNIAVLMFDKLGNCIRPGWWDPSYISRYEKQDECGQTDSPTINQQPITHEQS